MLKTRIITALIIFAATLALVFLPPSWLFRLLTALVLLTGCWEFRRLADLPATPGWVLQGLQITIFALMLYYWPVVRDKAMIFLAAGCLAWLLMLSSIVAASLPVDPAVRSCAARAPIRPPSDERQ